MDVQPSMSATLTPWILVLPIVAIMTGTRRTVQCQSCLEATPRLVNVRGAGGGEASAAGSGSVVYGFLTADEDCRHQAFRCESARFRRARSSRGGGCRAGWCGWTRAPRFGTRPRGRRRFEGTRKFRCRGSCGRRSRPEEAERERVPNTLAATKPVSALKG